MVHHPEDPEDVYRMHATFNAMGTESGRSLAGRPNLQNICTRGLYTKEIKSCLCTPSDEDYYIATIDYSSLQMRLAALDGNDSFLTKEFAKDSSDVHSLTANIVFALGRELDIETITVEQDGKTYEFLGGELVETKRGEIFARDLKEDDELIV